MSLSLEEITQLIKLVEESKFEVCQIQVGDLKLTLSNQLPGDSATGEAAAPTTQATSAGGLQFQAAQQPSVAEPSTKDQLVPIKAPIAGIFYGAPDPGAQPFVELGAFVDEDTTVGLIEVMKLYNTITAGVRGFVEQVLVKDQQLLEYGQTMFFVRPDSSGGDK